jgi:hypothetical protein
VFLFLITVAGLVLAHCLHQISRGRAARHWPATTGTVGDRIVSPYVFSVPILGGRFSYTYRIGNREFKGYRIWFGSDLAFSIPNPARTWLGELYTPGASVCVLYNPANPRESALKAGVSPGTYVLAAVSAAMILGGLASLWLVA